MHFPVDGTEINLDGKSYDSGVITLSALERNAQKHGMPVLLTSLSDTVQADGEDDATKQVSNASLASGIAGVHRSNVEDGDKERDRDEALPRSQVQLKSLLLASSVLHYSGHLMEEYTKAFYNC